MLTNDECREIIKNQEEDYYENMANDAEEDIDYVSNLADSCYDATFNNEIYLVTNNEFNNTKVIGKEVASNKFNHLLEDFIKGDDFRNARFQLQCIEYQIDNLNGFKIFYLEHNNKYMSTVTVEVIKSLSEYIEKVLYIKEKEDNKVFYRGHGKWQYKLTPGIYRKENLEILKNESSYIKEIISSYPKYFKDCKTALDYLSVLQHNGFPTRLLDFSENPLISLYMACDNNNDCAADVIRISVPKEYFKYYDSDTVSILSNIALAEDDLLVEYNNSIEEFNANISVKKLVHLIRNEKPFFKNEINSKHLEDTILFVKPKQDFERISNQSGLFALFGINKVKSEMPKIEYLDPPCDIKHFIIPKECKDRILAELSRININEANVYCDLEHVAKFYVKKSSNREIEKHIEKNEIEKQKEIEDIFNNI
ncbi:FRG domain-containing protein [Sedimentibacter sp.]|uniref:FRG domain-containing protein n=1 Tax=Sedimentibacter sp. TaxID=1960295 RepID=UPI0028A0C5E8|nr:FRG domain-containing protein [Sedimentibacter sp.]